MDSITKKVAEFYEEYNFPSVGALHNFDVFFALVGETDKKLLKNKKILDAGCGTGENSCFFTYHGAKVTGIDLSLSSLIKARNLAKKYKMNNVNFICDDLMEVSLKNNKFDYVVCEGVLHHLSDPYKGLVRLSKTIKKRGYIILGLYNRHSSLGIRFKRKWISLLGGDKEQKIKIANCLFNKNKILSNQNKIWIADQFTNPNETYFSFHTILNWFRLNNLEYVSSFPPIEIEDYLNMILNKDFKLFNFREIMIRNLIEKKRNGKFNKINGNRLLQIFIQLCWNLPGGKDYFYVCGKKK